MRFNTFSSASVSATWSPIGFPLVVLLRSHPLCDSIRAEEQLAQILFRNFRMLDPEKDEIVGGHEILVEGDSIREVSAKPIKAPDASAIDCGGRTLMPGLIDCHVHVTLSEVLIRQLEHVPLTLMAARAAVAMRAMLDRGFTTVRDTGGADWGLKAAVDQGLVDGPRGDASGMRPSEDHDVRRRRISLRSARQPAILAWRGRCGRGRSTGFRSLCLRARIYATGNPARRAGRRPYDRAWQSNRRGLCCADGAKGNAPDRQPGHLLRDARTRLDVRYAARHAREERSGHRGRAALARDLQARRCPGGLRHGSAWTAPSRPKSRIRPPQPGNVTS